MKFLCGKCQKYFISDIELSNHVHALHPEFNNTASLFSRGLKKK